MDKRRRGMDFEYPKGVDYIKSLGISPATMLNAQAKPIVKSRVSSELPAQSRKIITRDTRCCLGTAENENKMAGDSA